MLRSVRLVAVFVVAALALMGCGGDDDDGGGTVDLSDGLASAAVCNGEPSGVAPPSSDPGFSGYVYLNPGDGWTTGWFDTFGDNQAIVGDDAQSILCVTVTESSEGQRCPYEEDGEQFELVMMNATYQYELRHADTANVVANGTGSASAEPCPTFASWTSGEGERQDWPFPTEGDLDGIIATFTT